MNCVHGNLRAICHLCNMPIEIVSLGRDNKMDNVTKLVPTKSDQDIVDDLRKRIVDAYKPLLALCTEANSNGFALQITIGPDAFGTFIIQQLQIVKVYK